MTAATGPRWPQERKDTYAILGLVLLAWFVYRPLQPGSIDYVDFPENILVLQSADTFSARFGALHDVYVRAGRWNPVNLFALAAQWQFFGWDSLAWQVARFVNLGVVAVLAYSLFRRLQLGVVGSAVAVSLLIVSPAANMGWTRLSTGEPLALVFLLVGSHAALTPASRRASWTAAVMLLCLIWTKEILLAAWLLPILLTFTSLRRTSASNSPSLRQVFGPSALLLVIGAVPIVGTYLQAPPNAFARAYAAGMVPIVDVAGAFVAGVIPFSPVISAGEPSPTVPLVTFLVLLIAGWMAAFGRSERGRSSLILAIALSLPLIGALVYAPWPQYLLVYALPFLGGGSLLLGQAADSLYSLGRNGRLLCMAGLAIVLSFATFQASNHVMRTRAVIGAFAKTVSHVSAIEGIDSALVTVDEDQFDARGNFGPRFVTYARAMRLAWPATRDIRCADVPKQVPPGAVVVLLSAMCESGSGNSPSIVVHHKRYHWPDPRPIADSVTVAILGVHSR